MLTGESIKEFGTHERMMAYQGAMCRTRSLNLEDGTHRDVLSHTPALGLYLTSVLGHVFTFLEAACKALIIDVVNPLMLERIKRKSWHSTFIRASDIDLPLGDGAFIRLVGKILGAGKYDPYRLDPSTRLCKTLEELKKSNDECLRLLGHSPLSMPSFALAPLDEF